LNDSLCTLIAQGQVNFVAQGKQSADEQPLFQ
jgi:hypothetical protein